MLEGSFESHRGSDNPKAQNNSKTIFLHWNMEKAPPSRNLKSDRGRISGDVIIALLVQVVVRWEVLGGGAWLQ